MSGNSQLPREYLHKIGHHPADSVIIEGWTFRRCMCGMLLALSASGAVWWLKARASAQRIESLDQLYAALGSSCTYYRPPEARRSTLDAELRAARQKIKELTTSAPKAVVPQPEPKVAPPAAKPAPRIYLPNYQPTTRRGAARRG